jgi:hypothetical protein
MMPTVAQVTKSPENPHASHKELQKLQKVGLDLSPSLVKKNSQHRVIQN